MIQALDKIRDHYNLDRLAQAACLGALGDQEYFQESRRRVLETRGWFAGELSRLGYEVVRSEANFVFAAPPDRDGKRVYDGLYARKILVRHFADPSLERGLRFSIGDREAMETTLAALREIG